MFTGGSQFAFVGVIGAGGLAAAPAAIASAALLGVRNVAYGMRMSPVIGAGFWRARRRRAVHDRRVHRRLARPDDRRAPAPSASGSRASRSTSAGTCRPSPARCSATCWATRGRTGWMPRPPPPSSPCCGRGCGIASRSRSGIAAAVVATMLTPVLMPGVPVLVAAVVAIVVGWFNWLGADDEPPAEPEDVAERVGSVTGAARCR